MVTTYRLNADELSVQLIDLIKKSFPGKEIEITVLEGDATDYLKSNAANERRINEAIGRIEKNEGLVDFDPSSKK